MRRFINSTFLIILIVSACSESHDSYAGNGVAPKHGLWNELVQAHVKEGGMVDYKGFIAQKAKLDQYLELLSNNAPADAWSKEEKLAYWINAYNAFTVKLIVDNYPLKSIKDLNPTLSVPTVNTIWTKEWFKIGGEDFSLDRIEHKILRKDFEEPRIHFAVNCASFSCPILRAEAYTADKIDQQLDEQARIFLNDATRNTITPEAIRVSKIFSWFGGDFKKGQTLVQFINKYTEVDINDKAKVRFMKYDWALNDIKQGN